MSHDPNQPRRNQEPKTPSVNYTLYAVIGGAAVLFLAFYAMQMNTDEIAYTDLLKLVEARKLIPQVEASQEQNQLPTAQVGKPREERSEAARPQESDDGTSAADNALADRFVKSGEHYYYDANHLRIGKNSVSGQVRRSQQAPTTETDFIRGEVVSFRTYKSDNAEEELVLISAMKSAKQVDASFDWGFPKGPSVWRPYGPMFLISGLFLLFFFLMLRRLGGAGSPMAFGRSRGRLYAEEGLGVTFDYVAGIDEAVEEVREVVDFLKSPDKYQRLGGRIPKGVLLVGPPGTGKTLLAKAIAGEAGVPFFSLSGSDFVEMFVGVGAARVRDMFQQAEAKAPCIIFIDELDALGKSRGTSAVGGHDEREQTLNALLVEMDGFDSNNGVIVIAATNRPEMLDQALLRPGRFDRQVLVDRPDIRGRKDILKVHVKAVKLDPTVNLDEVAAISPGFAGADLANLVNEAALLAARKDKSAVGMAEFNEGVERVTAGLEKKQRVMNEDEKYRVAYHESGHALVAFSLPNTDPVHKVSIIPRGLAALGYTMQRPEGDRFLMTQPELESRIQVLLAGTVAEEIIFDDISTGAQNDLERATEIARSIVMDYGMSELGRISFRQSNRSAFLSGGGDELMRTYSEEAAQQIDAAVRRVINTCLTKVRDILTHRKDSLIALAEELMVVESVDAEDLRRIIEVSSAGPRVVPGTVQGARTSGGQPSNEDSPTDDQPGEKRPASGDA